MKKFFFLFLVSAPCFFAPSVFAQSSPLSGLQIKSVSTRMTEDQRRLMPALADSHHVLIHSVSDMSGSVHVTLDFDFRRGVAKGSFSEMGRLLTFEVELSYSEEGSSDCPTVDRESIIYEIELRPQVKIRNVMAVRTHWMSTCSADHSKIHAFKLPSIAPQLHHLVQSMKSGNFRDS